MLGSSSHIDYYYEYVWCKEGTEVIFSWPAPDARDWPVRPVFISPHVIVQGHLQRNLQCLIDFFQGFQAERRGGKCFDKDHYGFIVRFSAEQRLHAKVQTLSVPAFEEDSAFGSGLAPLLRLGDQANRLESVTMQWLGELHD